MKIARIDGVKVYGVFKRGMECRTAIGSQVMKEVKQNRNVIILL